MTRLVTISLKDEETFQRLQQEYNKSALITDLLQQYYEKQVKPKTKRNLTLDDIKELKEQAKEQEEEKQKAIIDIKELEEVEESLIEAENKLKEQERQKKEMRIKAIEGMIPTLFYAEDLEIKRLADMYEEERLNYDSLLDWGISKGLVPKPPKNEQH